MCVRGERERERERERKKKERENGFAMRKIPELLCRLQLR